MLLKQGVRLSLPVRAPAFLGSMPSGVVAVSQGSSVGHLVRLPARFPRSGCRSLPSHRAYTAPSSHTPGNAGYFLGDFFFSVENIVVTYYYVCGSRRLVRVCATGIFLEMPRPLHGRGSSPSPPGVPVAAAGCVGYRLPWDGSSPNRAAPKQTSPVSRSF